MLRGQNFSCICARTLKFRTKYENLNRNFNNYKLQFLQFLLINYQKLEQCSVSLLTSLQMSRIYNKINLISYELKVFL